MFPGRSRRMKDEGGRLNAAAQRKPAALILHPSSFILLLAMSLLLTTACRQKMSNQPKYDPLEPSDFFADGMSARPRIPGTVARGELPNDTFLATGRINGADGDGYPFAITAAVMDRGQERFNIYCSVCHGRAGDGNGMIPSRGLRHPPSFHTDALRNAKTGHFFDVMTNGFGAMPSYAVQIPVADRWAIIAYVRALQLSQNGTMNDLPADQRAKLGQGVSQ
jgi:mono/diheme cytochrome c family protein